MKTVLTTLNSKFIHSSLALRYLRAYGRTKGQAYDIVEYTINMPILDIVSDLTEYTADVIGFACYIWNIDMTLHVAQMVKAVSPKTRIVLGGPEVSYTARSILEANPFVDAIVQGEGEEAFTLYTMRLADGGDVLNPVIPGIVGRYQNGCIGGSDEVVEVKDLNTIPFPYEEADMEDLEHKIIYYESSRGCPFSCSYCLSGNRNTVRFFKTERTLKELQWFVDHGVKQVKFVDRTFNCAPAHHIPLLQWIHDKGGHTNFHMEMEAVLLKEQEVTLLSTAPKGRMQIEVGVQSTHEPTLSAIHRHNDWAHIQQVIKPIIASGRTHVHMDLIVGLPYEDYETFSKSFNDLFSLQPHALQIGFLKLLRGSGLTLDSEAYDYIADPKAPYEVLQSHVLPYEKVRFLKHFEDVFERFYNSERLRTVFGYISRQLVTTSQPNISGAFAYFEAMTKAWLAENLHKRNLGDREQLSFLYRFFKKQNDELTRELLAYDCLVGYGGKVRGDELGLPQPTKAAFRAAEAFWRNEELVQQYIPTYHFKEWRTLRKEYAQCDLSVEAAHYIGAEGIPDDLLNRATLNEAKGIIDDGRCLKKLPIIIDLKGRRKPFVRPEVIYVE